MAKKKKTGQGQQFALKLDIKDERVPKLLGLFFLFMGFYLFIAFTSYLFTWKEDFDKVYRFSLRKMLEGELEVSNWLGRLGAFVSDTFFQDLFGLPSFLFIFLLGMIGWSLIRREPLREKRPLIAQTLLVLLFLSVLLAFLFQESGFPWGGAVGEYISDWLASFLGSIGTVFLFLFLFVGIIVWAINPNFRDMTPRKAVKEVQYWFDDLINGRPQRRRAEEAATGEVKTLRPANDKEEAEEKKKSDVATLRPSEKKQEGEKVKDDNKQLAFDMEDVVSRMEKKKQETGNTELEIEAPTGSGPGASKPPGDQPALNPTLSVEQANKNHLEPYDPTLDLSMYEHPVLPLLNDYADQRIEIDRAELEANKDQIIETLLNYKIEITKIRATIGPTVTLYEIVPAPGVRISKIKNLEDDIALSLAALGIRIIAPIPGRGTIGIEVPNKKKQIVSLKEVLLSEKFKRAKMDLPIALGKTIQNEPFVADLAKMPHLLVAGATGQGKSVGINSILISLLYKKHPSQLKLVLIDPKKVELFPYAKLEDHFLGFLPGEDEPITTETSKVINVLNSLCIEMDQRYDLLKKGHARNIKEYNKKFVDRQLNPNNGHRFLPFIVLVIDEFADLIMTAGKEIELPIGRLAQLARAVGIHLVIATQRPSVNIITGVIKANFPARIGFKVTSKVDSRTILDAGGADQLIGRGDMLLSVGGDMVRLQGAFVDTPEVEQVIDFISNQQGYPIPYFLPEFHGDDEVHGSSGLKLSELDEMFYDAARLIVQNQHGSTSMIQRRMKLGYNRAGRIMDQLEAMGVVGPSEGSKAREVLIHTDMELERFLESLKENKQ
jgi:S-DNA-T family DNA segregation ATPase FtsK/SpoIIIE